MDPQEGKDQKGAGSSSKQPTNKNFTNLWKERDPHIREADGTPNYLNPKRSSPKHIVKTVKNELQEEVPRQPGKEDSSR